MNQKKHSGYSIGMVNKNMYGFSLIEFLVASILSMIVLIAVGSGYFIARQLNHTANSRLNVQQDLRNASNLIVRDTRMAGSFGCFNMTTHTRSSVSDKSALSGKKDFQLIDTTAKATDNLIPVKVIAANEFRPENFAATSDALIFQYGLGSGSIANPSEGVTEQSQIVLSNCNYLVRPNTNDLTNVIDNNLADLGNPTNRNDIAIMQYIVNAYVVGTAGGESGLFRFQLSNNGNWSDPQLLMSGINSMNIQYAYVNNCPTDQGNKDTFETFEFTKTLKTGTDAVTPAFIRLTLNDNVINAEKRSGAATNNVDIYNIDAVVRGGNTCANRTF